MFAIAVAQPAPALSTVTVCSAAQLVSAVQSAAPGTEIVLGNGTYRNVNITLSGNGAAGNAIVIRSQTPGGAIFTGRSLITLSGQYLVFRDFYFDRVQHDSASPAEHQVLRLYGLTHSQVTNNTFYQSGDLSSPLTHIVRVMNHSSHNRIDYNTFDGNRSMGIGILVRSGENLDNFYTVIDHNYFVNVPATRTVHPGSDGNGMESVQIGQGGAGTTTIRSNTTVTNNLFANVTGDGAEIISNKTSSNVVSFNTFRDSPAMLTLRYGNDSRAEGNFFFNTSGGIRAYGSNHVIVNNYFHDANVSIQLGPSDSIHDRAVNVTVANNTIIDAERNSIRIYDSSGTDILNNLIVAGQGRAIDNGSSANTTYTGNIVHLTGSATVGLVNTGVVLANPMMTLTAGLYRPTNSAIVINRGAFVSGVTQDMDGQTRIGGLDIGADEIAGTSAVRRPLTAADVGARTAAAAPSVCAAGATPTPSMTPTRTPTPTPAPQLTLQLALQSRPAAPNPAWVVPVAVRITRLSDNTIVMDAAATTDSQGRVVLTSLAPGSYRVRVKHAHTLASSVDVTLAAGGRTVTLPALGEGDADNNNIVNITDFSIVSLAFGAASGAVGFDARADFNMNNAIDLNDFALLAMNFGVMGAP